MLKQTFLMK